MLEKSWNIGSREKLEPCNSKEKLVKMNDCCFRYGMRYMAKVLQDALRNKFPDAPEKDVLKIVGNLIYYRYINSAIVAPDAFDIIDVTAHKGLTNDQRRNLGSVAKILQFAASNKGVSVENSKHVLQDLERVIISLLL